MDERYDLVRTVRDQRHVYIRNYMPHKIYGQHLAYMWETPTTRVWERMYKEGKLNAAQRKFWETKPPEELYDLEADRDEVNNLAGSEAHRGVLEDLRKAHRANELKIRDVGLLPEAEIHSRARGGAPYTMGHDPKAYPAERVLDAAEMATSLDPKQTPKLVAALKDADSGVRYWAAMGLLMRGESAVKTGRTALAESLGDDNGSVRIAAAEALGRFGAEEDLKQAMEVLLPLADAEKSGAYLAMQALNAIDALGPNAKPWKVQIMALPAADTKAPQRVRTEYIKRLLEVLSAV
jgi:uncharacterized sulfatase